MTVALEPTSGCSSRAPTGTSTRSGASTTPCEAIARRASSGLDVYPNQIEVITAEQMLDAYASTGMPLFYKHWSLRQALRPARGGATAAAMRGLAYEIVINSNPCITYIMEENTATMQALVIAHAAFGHNHFFKNNYLFRQWTDAERHPRLSGLRQELHRATARSATATRPSSGCSTPRTR